MKIAILSLLAVIAICTQLNAQTQETRNDMESINSIFDRMEAQGVDIQQPLLYGYFFFDNDKAKLEQLKAELVKQGYKIVGIDKKENGEFMLHVEKVEIHTRQSLNEKEKTLRVLAKRYKVTSYDGFDVGNADPTKPIVTDESFKKLINSKKDNALFDLGIKLYNLEIWDKATLVFKECLNQNVKPDTSAYKLGNALINLNRIEEGIASLENATVYNPKYTSAFFNIGATCYDIHQYEKSVKYYQLANNLKPNDDRILYGIAASQYGLQQFDKSLENCKKALVVNKDNENAKQLLQMLKTKLN